MQFSDGGPDIPDALLRAQRSGDLLFVVGAGVSKQAPLPLFNELAALLYEQLGQALPSEPGTLATVAETAAYELGQYDRAIGLLEQRVVDRHSQSQRRYSPVRTFVADLLRPPKRAKLDAHLNLLDLSRGADGQPRIVTTNFDTLFERAWKHEYKEQLPSSAGAGMPSVGSFDFSGILHLHGRIDDPLLGLGTTELVLTASNFGEAYMRNGWASRTVYDLLRRYTLVLVGYAADDPPMRYMLEASEEGRMSFPDLKPAYALARMEADDAGSTRQMWKAKGLQPLIFESYPQLYETLAGWAAMARDPLGWAGKETVRITAKSYAESDNADKNKLAYIANEISSVRAVSGPTNDPEWLDAIETDGRPLTEFDYRMWFMERLESSAAVHYAINAKNAQKPLISAAIDSILGFQENVKQPFSHFWLLYIQAFGRPRQPFGGNRRKVGQVTINKINHIVEELAPRLSIEKTASWFHEEKLVVDPVNVHDLARFSFKASHSDWKARLTHWPEDAVSEARLLGALDRCLTEICELARDAGLLEANGDLGTYDIAMVHAPEEGEGWVETDDGHGKSWKANLPDQNNKRFAPLIRLMTGLWRRLAGRDIVLAGRFARNWAERDEMIFKRLGAWAATVSEAGPRDLIERYLAETNSENYWFGDRNPEMVRFYCRRWNDLHPKTQRRLERTIIAGPSDDFIQSFNRRGRWQFAKAVYCARELTRIETAGGVLSQSAADKLNTLYRRYPKLPREMPIYANLVGGSWSGSGYSANTEALANIPDQDVLQIAENLETSNPIDQADIWQVFVQDAPERAFKALVAAQAKGPISALRWQPLISKYTYPNPALQDQTLPPLDTILAALLAMDDKDLLILVHTVTRLVESLADKTGDTTFPAVLHLWYRLCPIASSMDVEPDRETPLFEAARSHPLGVLAAAIITMQSNVPRHKNRGFDVRLASGFSALVIVAGRQGLIARAALVEQLPFLSWISTKWADDHLFANLLAGDDAALELIQALAATDALQRIPIFNRLKHPVLSALENERTNESVRENLSGAVLTAAFDLIGGSSKFNLTRIDVRRALTRMPNAALASMAWSLWRMLANLNSEFRADFWSRKVKPFLIDYWPNDVTARTEEVSANLAKLPAVAGDAFVEAVDTIVHLVRPISLYEIRYGLDFDEEPDRVRLFPRASLLLLSEIIDHQSSPPSDLPQVMANLLEADPDIARHAAFWRLRHMERPR